MGSHAMFSQMVTFRRSALVVLALVASVLPAFAQFEIEHSEEWQTLVRREDCPGCDEVLLWLHELLGEL